MLCVLPHVYVYVCVVHAFDWNNGELRKTSMEFWFQPTAPQAIKVNHKVLLKFKNNKIVINFLNACSVYLFFYALVIKILIETH